MQNLRRLLLACFLTSVTLFMIFMTVLYYNLYYNWNNYGNIRMVPLPFRDGLLIQRSRGFVNLSWSTLFLSQNILNKSSFISAYYDGRLDVTGRPAVVIISYSHKSALKSNFVCYFMCNGNSSCSNNVRSMQQVADCFLSKKRMINIEKPIAQLIVCPVSHEVDVPSVVRLGLGDDYNEKKLSGEIIVGNRYRQYPKAKIGVCLQGSLRQDRISNMLEKLDDFIGMCQFLGAEFITMYVSPNEVHRDIIAHLLTNHSQFVILVEWRVFKSNDYHGQGGIIHDCIYRHMYAADYLVLMDLDEMITPLKHFNWNDMLEELEKKSGGNYAGYSFVNRFYLSSNFASVEYQRCSEVGKKPIYLKNMDELQCTFRHGVRSKYIVKPELVIQAAVHKLCKTVMHNALFPVEVEFAVNAHYRINTDRKCKKSKSILIYDILKPLLTRFTNIHCNSSDYQMG